MKKFSKGEDDLILKEEKAGMSVKDVSKILGRNESSVLYRFGCLTYGKSRQVPIEEYTFEQLCEQLQKMSVTIEGNKLVKIEMRRTEFDLNQ